MKNIHFPCAGKTIALISFSQAHKTTLFISMLFFFGPCTMSSQELYSTSNAGHPTSEANTVDGWTGNATETSTTEAVHSGSFAIKLTAPGDGWYNSTYSFPMTVGQKYKIVIYAKNPNPSEKKGFYQWEGFSDFKGADLVANTSDWHRYEFQFTAAETTGVIRVYTGHPSVTGSALYLDNISITPITSNENDPEIYTQPNAASPANESPTTFGWGDSGGTALTAETDDVFDGLYALKIEAVVDNGARRGIYTFPTTSGVQYKIAIHAKKLSGSPGFWAWKGFSDFDGGQAVDSNDWKKYEFLYTASGTQAEIRAYAGAPASLGDALLVDKISILDMSKVDSESPTAPSVALSGKTDTTVSLSWSGATDNVGVTNYAVYRNGTLATTLGSVANHTVTGLSASTTYQFKIRALDAPGNESGDSNVVSATTEASSGGGGDSGTTGGHWTKESDDRLHYTAGNVGIGTSTPRDYKLAVNGDIRAKKVKVETANWPDYVFTEDHDLPTLEEVRQHIAERGHLPNIPPATEVKANGLDLGEMDRLLLEKIEELTLYILELKEENQNTKKNLQQQIDTLKSQLNDQ